MLRRDRMVGALVIHRKVPGDFGPETLRLLETFAAQSALAILNARLFRDLDRSRAELEVASRHKSEFLASMSHELRTPLNAVIGFSEVLLDQLFGEVNDRQAEYLRDIRNSGKHLLELLNEILDLSKVEAGKMMLEPQRFDVASVLEYSLGLLRQRAASHGITLELFVPAEVGVVDADELRFKQVVVNLLTNAVKFTPDGGRVTVAARRVGDELQVTVTDTGIGVPPDDRERIFESFQQGGRGAPKEEGTGLGLTLSRRIVELFGGRMWLESEVGVGSTFGFAVPVESPSTPRGQRPRRGNEGGRPIVLIADDDPRSAELLAAYLDGSPIEVRRCQDGEEALEAARLEPPAALLLDIRLPALDGWGVLRAVKEDPATAHVPVVVVTVVDEPRRGLAMGASGYLVKPVTREDLLDALAPRGGPRPGPSRGRGAPVTAPATVLVVEDNALNLKLMRDVLEHAGFTVLVATSGEEGVDVATRGGLDLVLMDLQLPGIDGTEAMRRIRAHPGTRELPVVAVTAFAMLADREQVSSAGFDGYIEKPISTRALPEMVRRYV